MIDDIGDKLVGEKVEPVVCPFPGKPSDDKLPALSTPADRARLGVPFPVTTPEGQRETVNAGSPRDRAFSPTLRLGIRR